MVAVAVKVTVVPGQMLVDGLAAILTDAGKDVLMVIPLLVAVATPPVGQGTLLVITQVITSPVVSVLSEYAVLLVPTLLPFFFHW